MALPPAGTYIDMPGGGLYDEKQQQLATVASNRKKVVVVVYAKGFAIQAPSINQYWINT
jgi:hypothetical protein